MKIYLAELISISTLVLILSRQVAAQAERTTLAPVHQLHGTRHVDPPSGEEATRNQLSDNKQKKYPGDGRRVKYVSAEDHPGTSEDSGQRALNPPNEPLGLNNHQAIRKQVSADDISRNEPILSQGNSVGVGGGKYASFGANFNPGDLFGLQSYYHFGPLQSQGSPGLSQGGAGFPAGLGSFLSRMPSSGARPTENLDHCPKRAEIGIQYYCVQLEDGLYYDPWNPWCGYIECSEGVARRVCCKRGSWLGMPRPLKVTLKDLCRKPMKLKIHSEKCPVPTTNDMCKAAHGVEDMNPKIKVTKPDPATYKPFNPTQSGAVYREASPDLTDPFPMEEVQEPASPEDPL